VPLDFDLLSWRVGQEASGIGGTTRTQEREYSGVEYVLFLVAATLVSSPVECCEAANKIVRAEDDWRFEGVPKSVVELPRLLTASLEF
jgi:hypothetical protein